MLPQVMLQPVAKVVDKPCPRGSHGVPGPSNQVCYYLASEQDLVAIQSAKVVREAGKRRDGQPVYTVNVTLLPGATVPLNVLISALVHQPTPRNELAWIAGGKVLASPAVTGKVPATFQLTAPGGLAAQQRLLKELEAAKGDFIITPAEPGHVHTSPATRS